MGENTPDAESTKDGKDDGSFLRALELVLMLFRIAFPRRSAREGLRAAVSYSHQYTDTNLLSSDHFHSLEVATQTSGECSA